MKSLLFVLIGLAMFLLGGSTATATTTTKGFADTFLFEDFDVGLSPSVTTNATVNATESNQFDFAAFIVTDYPEASSKARLCGDYTNIPNPNPVPVALESTANALRAERLCNGEGKYKRNDTTERIAEYRTALSHVFWHGSDSKASR